MVDQNDNKKMVPEEARRRRYAVLSVALFASLCSLEIDARPEVYAVGDDIEAVFGSPPEAIGTVGTGGYNFVAYQGDDPNSLISYMLLSQEGTNFVGLADLERYVRDFAEGQSRSVNGELIHFSFGRIGDNVGAYLTIQYEYRSQVAIKHAVVIYRSGRLYQWGMDYYPANNKGSPKLFSRYAESFRVDG